MNTGYFKQQGSTHIIYGRVVDLLKNGGLKLIAVTICDGHTSKAKQLSTKGSFPAFIEIDPKDIPIKILNKINAKFN